MRRNAVVVLVAAIGGACWIGSVVSGMLLSRADVVAEKDADQSVRTAEPAVVEDVSPFAVVETGSSTSTLQSQAGAPAPPRVPPRVPPRAPSRAPAPESIDDRPLSGRSLQRLLEQPLTGESETALLRNLQAWSVSEPAEAALWIERTLSEATPGSAADALVNPLLYQWLKIEPETALARQGAFADEDEVPYLLLSHAKRLGSESTPVEALEWARSLEDEAARAVVVDGVLRSWLERDVAAMATQLESENPELIHGTGTAGDPVPGDRPATSSMSDDFKERVVAALMERDPARAMRWADALPDSDAKKVQSEVLDSWLIKDPVAARDWLSNVLADTGTLSVSLASVVPRRDIDLAIGTLPSLSDASRDAMTSAIVETLSETDPDHAREWVDGLLDPGDRSIAVTSWAIANAGRRPGEALDSALESTSGGGRLDTLMVVAAVVAQIDEPLLESWLAAASLNDYERSQMASVVFESDIYPFQ